MNEGNAKRLEEIKFRNKMGRNLRSSSVAKILVEEDLEWLVKIVDEQEMVIQDHIVRVKGMIDRIKGRRRLVDPYGGKEQ